MSKLINLFKFLYCFCVTPSNFKKDYAISILTKRFTIIPDHNCLPWMNYKVINFLNKYLYRNSMIFEYGSGASTHYWISKGFTLFSVEHDKSFFDRL